MLFLFLKIVSYPSEESRTRTTWVNAKVGAVCSINRTCWVWEDQRTMPRNWLILASLHAIEWKVTNFAPQTKQIRGFARGNSINRLLDSGAVIQMVDDVEARWPYVRERWIKRRRWNHWENALRDKNSKSGKETREAKRARVIRRVWGRRKERRSVRDREREGTMAK